MKVSELEGAELDYWVYRSFPEFNFRYSELNKGFDTEIMSIERSWGNAYESLFTESWQLAGPVIEREKITFEYEHDSCTEYLEGNRPDDRCWFAFIYDFDKPVRGYKDMYKTKATKRGPTPLIAAMRCLVASKFGEEVPDA